MAEETKTQATESMNDYKEELEASFRKLSEGDIVTGTVIAVTEEDVTLDLRYYASGIIKASEISSDPDFNLLESVHIGDTLEATIIRMDDGEGNLLLSRKEANEVLAWDKLNQYMENGTNLSVRIKGIVPSGVITYLEGIRGFIPASHLSLDYVEDCNPWLGKDVEVRVITVDESRKKDSCSSYLLSAVPYRDLLCAAKAGGSCVGCIGFKADRADVCTGNKKRKAVSDVYRACKLFNRTD